MKTTKRILSLLLCMALVLGMIPVFASAEGNEITVTYAFSVAKASSTAYSASTLKTEFDNAASPEDLTVKVDSTGYMYPGNSNGGTFTGTNFLKAGSSKQPGSMVLTFNQEITKVAIKCHAWNSSEGGTISVNNTAQTLAKSGTASVLTFDLSAKPSSTVTIKTSKRAYIFEIAVTYVGSGVNQDTCTHEWGEGQVTKEPTVLTEGEMTYVCTLCKKIDVQPIGKATSNNILYSEYTSATLVNGTYIIVATNGYALGTYDGSWITAITPYFPEDGYVTDDMGGVWSLTVDDAGNVIMKDATGKVVGSVGNSTTGITTGEYVWKYIYNTETGKYSFTSEDSTTYLCSNHSSSHQFRAYTDKSGNNSYTQTFTLYKKVEDTVCTEHNMKFDTTATTHQQYCDNCKETFGDVTFHNMDGENGTCADCGYAVDAATLVAAIVEATVALEHQAILGTFTLTGEIVSVDDAYSEQYGNITVTIKI